FLHDGRIEYWPNEGYGRFGARITMEDAPRLGPGADPRRVFLADLDGTGCADLVFVEADRVRFWFNRSGNGWSAEQVIDGTPWTAGDTAVTFADVFGTGTATLLWSYPAGRVADGAYKALDLCGGVKPHLLEQVVNNHGASTRIRYASSTRFAVADRAAGAAWATTLPFPVHVVSAVETIDEVTRTKRVASF